MQFELAHYDSALPREIQVETDSVRDETTTPPLETDNAARFCGLRAGLEQERDDDISEIGDTASVGNVSGNTKNDKMNVEAPVRAGSRFTCNICLDTVNEPVVTRCGHLYCWPCLYQWLEPGITTREKKQLVQTESPSTVDTITSNNLSMEEEPVAETRQSPTLNIISIDFSRRCCPVCKSECTVETIVPIYVEGDANHQARSKVIVPSRPQPVVQPRRHEVSRRRRIVNRGDIGALDQSIVPVLLGMDPSIMRSNSGLSNISHISNLSQSSENFLSEEGDTNEFLSRLLLLLGSFVIFVLLLF